MFFKDPCQTLTRITAIKFYRYAKLNQPVLGVPGELIGTMEAVEASLPSRFVCAARPRLPAVTNPFKSRGRVLISTLSPASEVAEAATFFSILHIKSNFKSVRPNFELKVNSSRSYQGFEISPLHKILHLFFERRGIFEFI